MAESGHNEEQFVKTLRQNSTTHMHSTVPSASGHIVLNDKQNTLKYSRDIPQIAINIIMRQLILQELLYIIDTCDSCMTQLPLSSSIY